MKAGMEPDRTVYVVDDDESARTSMAALVSSMGARTELFESAEDFLSNFDPQRPGCLVTDLRMGGMSGTELQRRLSDEGIRLPVIIITAHAETPVTVKAVQCGAVTVLEKPCRDYELCDAIRDAFAQDAKSRLQSDLHKRLDTLTSQEQAVLDMMVNGVANKVIAARLDISVRTVENRRRRIFEKTQTNSLAELVKLVVQASP